MLNNNPITKSKTLVNVDNFNNLLKNKGGKAIKTTDKNIIMREFINKLIKAFRKDFIKKTKKGGMADLYPSQEAFRFQELNFSREYTNPPMENSYDDML
jgi:hypothetical protein